MKPFACPVCKAALRDRLFCVQCKSEYPSINGIPILLNEINSVSRSSDYSHKEAYQGASAYGGSRGRHTGLRRLYRIAMLYLGERSPRKREFEVGDAVDAILSALPHAGILVIGSGDTTIRGQTTCTDVAFGANVTCIADAHDLPFVDKSFDACIAVAVLEHVVDPFRCVHEIQRVLRPSGYVYAETPFMQPVHMGTMTSLGSLSWGIDACSVILKRFVAAWPEVLELAPGRCFAVRSPQLQTSLPLGDGLSF